MLKLKTLILCSVCLTIPTSYAAASISLIDDVSHEDSGWTVSLDGAAFSVDSIDVDLASAIKTVTITVTSKYIGYAWDGDDIEFPVAKFRFNQVESDANTVSRIIIQSEDIYNNTGLRWSNYEWLLSPVGAVDFNQAESAGWDVSPFTTKNFVTGDYLSASGGHVLFGDGSLPDFIPDTNLVIDVDLTSSASALSFDLKERITSPVPEPATLLLTGMGWCVCLLRKGGCGQRVRKYAWRKITEEEKRQFIS